MSLRGKHASTLRAVFADPVRANVPWRDVEALFEALGAEIDEGGGSRVRVAFDRPHPEKETDKGALRSVRRFLLEAGVLP